MAYHILRQPDPQLHTVVVYPLNKREDIQAPGVSLRCRTPEDFANQTQGFRSRLTLSITPGRNQCDCRIKDVIEYAVTNMRISLETIYGLNCRAFREGRGSWFVDVVPWQLDALESHLFNEVCESLQGIVDFSGWEGMASCSSFGMRNVWDQKLKRAGEDVCYRIAADMAERYPPHPQASGQASGQAS